MRVGFLRQLLWTRYGDFWLKLLQSFGAEPCFAEDEAIFARLLNSELNNIPGLSFRLAVAEVLSLRADAIILPELNYGSHSQRGSAQDPWIASFPQMLQHSLPPVAQYISVPAQYIPSDALDSIVFNQLAPLGQTQKLRLALERVRYLNKIPHYKDPRWSVSGLKTVAVIGQPWLIDDSLLEVLAKEGLHLIGQHQFDPQMLQAEGKRLDKKRIATDLEVMGAAHFLSRKGAVEALWCVLDQSSGADMDLWRRLEKLELGIKPLYLQEQLKNWQGLLKAIPSSYQRPTEVADEDLTMPVIQVEI
ncbi:MAG: hypothetical protein R2880_09075 [Deinococcales bacterium]